MSRSQHPNLLLVVAETLRSDAVHGAGGCRARTPHLDAFAEGAALFPQRYAPMAFCTPARCSLLTGRYPHTHGHRAIWHLLQPEERHLYRDLAEAGFHNVVFGKNDAVDARGVPGCFHEWQLCQRPEAPPPGDDGRIGGDRAARLMYGGRVLGDVLDLDEVITRSAESFLAATPDGPWSLSLNYALAHPTYAVAEPYFGTHQRDAMAPPLPPYAEGKRRYAAALDAFYRGAGREEADLREVRATYLGMVSRLDALLGRVLNALHEHGHERETVVVIVGDHGDYAGDYGLVEKFFGAYEDCLLRVPLYIRSPYGHPSGERNGLCEIGDCYPTVLELLGLESSHAHWGRSLLPQLADPGAPGRDDVLAIGGRDPSEASFLIGGLPPDSFNQRRAQAIHSDPLVGAKAAMLRTRNHKLIVSPDDRDEFFDLRRDPAEHDNRIDEPVYAEVVAGMRQRLFARLLQSSDTVPPRQGSRQWPPVSEAGS